MPFDVTGSGVDVPDGTYTATLEGVQHREDGGFNNAGFRIWEFLLDVNGTLTPLSGQTSFNTGPKSKAYAWLTAILRRELKAGEHIDDPIGQKCLVTVTHNQRGYSTISGVASFSEPAMVDGVPR